MFFSSKNVSLPGTVGNWPWLGTKATAVCLLKDIGLYTAVCLVKFNFSSNTYDLKVFSKMEYPWSEPADSSSNSSPGSGKVSVQV